MWFCTDFQYWLYIGITWGALKSTDSWSPFQTFWFNWSRVHWDFKNTSQRDSKKQSSLITMALVTPSCLWLWFSFLLYFAASHSPSNHQLLFLCYNLLILITFVCFILKALWSDPITCSQGFKRQRIGSPRNCWGFSQKMTIDMVDSLSQ